MYLNFRMNNNLYIYNVFICYKISYKIVNLEKYKNII